MIREENVQLFILMQKELARCSNTMKQIILLLH